MAPVFLTKKAIEDIGVPAYTFEKAIAIPLVYSLDYVLHILGQ